MSLTTMTQVAGSIFIANGLGLMLSAYIVDKWIARGGSANVAYKTVLAVSSAGVAMSLFLCTVVGPMGAVVALLATGVLDGLNSPLWGSLAQTFAGPQASGRWMGMQNSVANAAGMVAPVSPATSCNRLDTTRWRCSFRRSWVCSDSWRGSSCCRRCSRSIGRPIQRSAPDLSPQMTMDRCALTDRR